jgi:hypothetical protein
VERLRGIVISALATGNAVLVVATAAHRVQLSHALHEHWTNWAAARAEGRLVLVDAQEVLDQFLVDGRPDRKKFVHTVSELIRQCRFTSLSANRGLTVFGEMVSLLWEQGHRAAAIDLEGLWNELLSDRTFHLHCAYARRSVEAAGDGAALHQVCGHHSQVVGALPVVA